MRPWSRTIRRGGLLGALLLVAAAPQAGGAVQLGQLAPDTAGNLAASNFDEIQLGVASGPGYTVPGTGMITSWSTNASGFANQMWTMKAFRRVAGSTSTYVVVGHDGPRTLAPNAVNTFPASVAVQPGDLLGFHFASTGRVLFNTADPADQRAFRMGNLGDGFFTEFDQGGGGRLNIAAVFDPSNSFSILGTKRNKRKGAATLTVRVPNPGELDLRGKGVKRSSAARAVAAKTVAAGKVKLKVRAKGKLRGKLNATGKATVKPKLTFTPTGGEPRTRSTKVRLRKLG